MLKNKVASIKVLEKVAKALGELNEQVAFVGGATVSLYADDPAADDVRPTKDIDIVIHLASFAELTALQETLGQKGIYPDPVSNVICRFLAFVGVIHQQTCHRMHVGEEHQRGLKKLDGRHLTGGLSQALKI
jgi:hypothetical protein